MTPGDVTKEFRSWVGVPWIHQGRNRHGIDCAGLIVCALGNLKLLPERFEDPRAYGREPQAQMAKIVERFCDLSSGLTLEGSLVLVRWKPDQEASHLAYCTGRNLIHAYSRMVGRGPTGPRQAGRVVEHRYGEPWLRQTCGVYLIPGVEYP